MSFLFLAIVADVATLTLTTHNATTFQRSVTGALRYLQMRACPHTASISGFDARMKAIEALASLFTVLTYLPNLSPADLALILALITLAPNKRDQ